MGIKFMVALALENPKKLIGSLSHLNVTLNEVDWDSLYYIQNLSKSKFVYFLEKINSTKKESEVIAKLAFKFEEQDFCLTYTEHLAESLDFFGLFIIGLQLNMAKNITQLTNSQIQTLARLFDLLKVDFAWITADEHLNGEMFKTKENPLNENESPIFYARDEFVNNIPRIKLESINFEKSNSGAIYSALLSINQRSEQFEEFRQLLRQNFNQFQSHTART